MLARSAKYHRARGPQCLAGRCDGCLVRAEGRPSVPTCTLGAEPALRLETQNVVGSAEHDLLALTDQLFAQGLDHHTLMTETRVGNALMQRVARRVAGLGQLPSRAEAPSPVRRTQVDLLVVGEGETARAHARAERARGRRVLLVGARGVAGVERREAEVVSLDRLNPLEPGEDLGGWAVLLAASAPMSERGAQRARERMELVRATELAVEPPASESLPLFPGRDHAGVYASSALERLETADVAMAGSVVVVAAPGMEAAASRTSTWLSRRGASGPAGASAPRVIEAADVVTLERTGALRLRLRLRLRSGAELRVEHVVVQGWPRWDLRLLGLAGVSLPFDSPTREDPLAYDSQSAGGTFRVDMKSLPRGLRVLGAIVAERGDARASSSAERVGSRTPAAAAAVRGGARGPAAAAERKCVVCRCEDVTLRELEEAFDAGAHDLESLKRVSGFGTGYCQGRDCTEAAARWLVERGGQVPSGPITPRPPVRPVSFAALAGMIEEELPR